MIEEERIKPSSRIRDILLRRSVLFAITTLAFGACILLIAFGLYAKPRERTEPVLSTARAQNFQRPSAIDRCPEQYGLQVYPNPQYCDEYYKCANGTLTSERCENGLLFDGKGAVHEHCNYYWAVNCGDRIAEIFPEPSPYGCEYQFGIFPSKDSCYEGFTRCAYGEPEEVPCTLGLAYDDRIHACNWPDLVPGCVPEDIVKFTCPDARSIDPLHPAYKYLPYPRFPRDCYSLYTCVHDRPRLITCSEGKFVNQITMTCEPPERVPECR